MTVPAPSPEAAEDDIFDFRDEPAPAPRTAPARQTIAAAAPTTLATPRASSHGESTTLAPAPMPPIRSDMYNGVFGGQVYLVRFVSCVALHAVWSGAAAIFIFRHQAQLQTCESVWSGMITWVALVAFPMVLHGLYDTLLKKEMEGWALLTALVSFAWLIDLIEGARRDFPEEEALPGTA